MVELWRHQTPSRVRCPAASSREPSPEWTGFKARAFTAAAGGSVKTALLRAAMGGSADDARKALVTASAGLRPASSGQAASLPPAKPGRSLTLAAVPDQLLALPLKRGPSGLVSRSRRSTGVGLAHAPWAFIRALAQGRMWLLLRRPLNSNRSQRSPTICLGQRGVARRLSKHQIHPSPRRVRVQQSSR